MRFFSVCILPAVSIRTTSILFFSAYFIASNPTDAGSEPYSWEITFTSSFSPCFFNCSIEAARKVSPAAHMHERFFFFSISVIFAIVVVFPVPFIPQNRITKGLFSVCFILRNKSKGSIKTS